MLPLLFVVYCVFAAVAVVVVVVLAVVVVFGSGAVPAGIVSVDVAIC